MKIVCISDTHLVDMTGSAECDYCRHPRVEHHPTLGGCMRGHESEVGPCGCNVWGGSQAIPEGDILIHAGDSLMYGDEAEFLSEVRRMARFPGATRVYVAGNHDRIIQERTSYCRNELTQAGWVYLEDEVIEVRGLRIYGSPWTPRFGPWAFMRQRGEDIRRMWQNIPDQVDVLVTHGPPHGILDTVTRLGVGEHVGCEELRYAVDRVRPRVHVFGHIHCGYGTTNYRWGDGRVTKFVNAAIMGETYEPANKPIVVEI